jgi:hypothetical protein
MMATRCLDKQVTEENLKFLANALFGGNNSDTRYNDNLGYNENWEEEGNAPRAKKVAKFISNLSNRDQLNTNNYSDNTSDPAYGAQDYARQNFNQRGYGNTQVGNNVEYHNHNNGPSNIASKVNNFVQSRINQGQQRPWNGGQNQGSVVPIMNGFNRNSTPLGVGQNWGNQISQNRTNQPYPNQGQVEQFINGQWNNGQSNNIANPLQNKFNGTGQQSNILSTAANAVQNKTNQGQQGQWNGGQNQGSVVPIMNGFNRNSTPLGVGQNWGNQISQNRTNQPYTNQPYPNQGSVVPINGQSNPNSTISKKLGQNLLEKKSKNGTGEPKTAEQLKEATTPTPPSTVSTTDQKVTGEGTGEGTGKTTEKKASETIDTTSTTSTTTETKVTGEGTGKTTEKKDSETIDKK